MSPEPQEELAATPKAREEHTQPIKHESPTPQQASWPPPCDDACAQSIATVPIKLEEKPIEQEAHMPLMAAGSDSMGVKDCSSAAQNSTGAGDVLNQALEPNGEHNMPVVAAPATESEKQMEEQMNVDIETSDGFDQKEDAMAEVYSQLIKEEIVIGRRIGTPFEKPTDKARLPILKREIERSAEALEEDKILEDITIAQDMKVVQDAIGVDMSALRTTSVKPTSSRKKSRHSTGKKRKGESENSGNSQKKRKLTQATKGHVKDADAIFKYQFDQLAGRGTEAKDKKSLMKALPTHRGLVKGRKEDKMKIQAAAKKIETKDNKASIEVDIHSIIGMTRPFGKSCKMKLLRGDENSEEERDIGDYAWEIEGMASPLRHHQLLAAGYMCNLERAGDYRGGLLFDYMGYGKTLESFGLIKGNKPLNVSKHARDSGAATTLVVVPTAAARQWSNEIKLHCPDLTVAHWNKQLAMSVLLGHDILVVTYIEVRMAYSKAGGSKKRERKKDQKDNKQEPEPILDHPLFQTKFHRIILDEMHEIKGYHNITCDSVMALSAEHKWGMTGTPTPNGIEELFPYLKFIGHPEVTTIRDFRARYVGGQGRHALSEEVRFQRLRELLGPVMIMRTPSQRFLGSTLLKLPQAHALPPITVRFSAEEQIIYDSISKAFHEYVEEQAAAEGKELDIQVINESLVRLRQCLTCPFLLEKMAKEGFWTIELLALMRQKARAAGAETTPFIDQIEQWIFNNDTASPPADSTLHSNCIANARATLYADTCPGNGCEKTIEQLMEPQVAECGHRWCKPCLEKQVMIETMIEKRETPQCNRCHKPLGEAMPYTPIEPDGGAAEHTDQASTSQRRRGEDYNGKQPRLASKGNNPSYLDRDPTGKLPRSAKVAATIDQIVKWQDEAPDDKIIVFIQWVELNGILGRILQEEGIDFLYYTSLAGMKDEDRMAAIETFKQDPKVKVLICSLRCGGQALNLTCANRTIMVDLWWNHSVEAQATARVYRMGQQKETYSVRILVEDSVDQRIYNLQEKKLQLLKNAYQEFEADKGLDKETLYELMGLPLGEGASSDEEIDFDSDDDDSDASYKP